MNRYAKKDKQAWAETAKHMYHEYVSNMKHVLGLKNIINFR